MPGTKTPTFKRGQLSCGRYKVVRVYGLDTYDVIDEFTGKKLHVSGYQLRSGVIVHHEEQAKNDHPNYTSLWD